ncbi:MAG: sec-independent protein translocase protein TatB [Paracoccaceae bacterium]|jgi:sec-independent protein translocase protein TatB
MPSIGSTELLLIALVALIVVGPKDLPGMFKTAGKYTAKVKKMAREFTKAMEDAADDAGVKDISANLSHIADPKKMGLDAVKKATDFSSYTKDSETQKLADDLKKKADKTLEDVEKRKKKRDADPLIPTANDESSLTESVALETQTKSDSSLVSEKNQNSVQEKDDS